MNEAAMHLFRQSLMTLGTVGGPLFAALLVVGLFVGLIQATTQINDAAVGALPRLATAVAVCFFLGGWMMDRMSGFLAQTLTRMASP